MTNDVSPSAGENASRPPRNSRRSSTRRWVGRFALSALMFLMGSAVATAVLTHFMIKEQFERQQGQRIERARFAAAIAAYVQLREDDQAVARLNEEIDSNVGAMLIVAQASEHRDASLLTPAEQEGLSEVKYYRQVYPAHAGHPTWIDQFLTSLPNWHPGAACTSALCRVARSAPTSRPSE